MTKPPTLYGHPAKAPKMKRPEQIIQIGVVKFLRDLEARWPEEFFFFHPPNGGGRSKAEGAIFKQMGVRAGVSDLFIMFPERGDGSMLDIYYPPRISIIEFKAGKKKATDSQGEFGEKMQRWGFDWHLVGANDVTDGIVQTLRIMIPMLPPWSPLRKLIGKYQFPGGIRV